MFSGTTEEPLNPRLPINDPNATCFKSDDKKDTVDPFDGFSYARTSASAITGFDEMSFK